METLKQYIKQFYSNITLIFNKEHKKAIIDMEEDQTVIALYQLIEESKYHKKLPDVEQARIHSKYAESKLRAVQRLSEERNKAKALKEYKDKIKQIKSDIKENVERLITNRRKEGAL